MQSLTIVKDTRERIAALCSVPEDCDYLLIICHGFRGRKENTNRIFPFAQRINNLGMGVLAFDFIGSGESDGNFSDITLSSQARDLQAVINYADITWHKPIILLGRSFGGSTVLAGGTDSELVKGYILWSTPVDLIQAFTPLLEENDHQFIHGRVLKTYDSYGEFYLKPSFIEDFYHHNMDEYLAKVGSRPVLIIHAQNDEVVPVYHARYLYHKLQQAEINIVDNTNHRFENKIKEREDITINWLKKHFKEQRKCD